MLEDMAVWGLRQHTQRFQVHQAESGVQPQSLAFGLPSAEYLRAHGTLAGAVGLTSQVSDSANSAVINKANAAAPMARPGAAPTNSEHTNR